MKKILLFLVFVREAYGVIYRLNESMLARMPPLYQMDDYNGCLANMSHYCTIHFTLVSDQPNDLLFTIQEYSMKESTRLNYTKLRYGVCVKEKCDSYAGNNGLVSEEHLEACLNESFTEKYQLKTKISNIACNTKQRDIFVNADVGDFVVAVTLLSLLMLNLIGSLYDVISVDEKYKKSNFLSYFSISQNWRCLWASSEYGDEMKRFEILYSIRALIIIGIIAAHVLLPFLLIGDNPRAMEDSYMNPILALIMSGPLIIQTYFVMSGFLLAYKMQIHFKKNNIDVLFLPRLIFFRWLRLTPPYAVLLAFMATWLRFFKTGPFWEITSGLEISDCRRRWWLNLLYINNYFYHDQCMPHAWYLAADMQLYIIGALVCIILKYMSRKTLVLFPLFLAGLIIPALHTYFQDLDPMLILKPSGCSTFFDSDKTYNEVYKPGHTNLVGYAIGLSTGYILMYLWKIKDEAIEKYKKYFFLLWFIIPVGAAFMYLGSVFYRDAPRDPLYIRVIFAMISRPFMGFLAAFFILGMILKIESLKSINDDTLKNHSKLQSWRHQVKDLLRIVMNWQGWVVPGRLSYCVYLVHFPILRIATSTATSLIPSSPIYIVIALAVLTVVSFVVALPLCLLVELPFIRLIKERKEKSEQNVMDIVTRL